MRKISISSDDDGEEEQEEAESKSGVSNDGEEEEKETESKSGMSNDGEEEEEEAESKSGMSNESCGFEEAVPGPVTSHSGASRSYNPDVSGFIDDSIVENEPEMMEQADGGEDDLDFSMVEESLNVTMRKKKRTLRFSGQLLNTVDSA